LKLGVLAEDGIWNLLSDASELKKRMEQQVFVTLPSENNPKTA
jgi:hypothetical protein